MDNAQAVAALVAGEPAPADDPELEPESVEDDLLLDDSDLAGGALYEPEESDDDAADDPLESELTVAGDVAVEPLRLSVR